MARMETGHIHLRSSILHHTESWGNKELEEGTAMGTPARMQTQHTYAAALIWFAPSVMETHTGMEFTVWKPQTQGTHNFSSFFVPPKIVQTHTQTHRDTWSTFQPKMMKYEMEHYRLEWQSAQDYAGPLSHCLPLPEKKKKRERKEGEKKKTETVNSGKKKEKNKLRFLSLFLLIYFWDFSIRKLDEISDGVNTSTCGLGIRTSLSYVWGLAIRQTATHVNNILDWVMTWWIMNVSPGTSSQHQQWPS